MKNKVYCVFYTADYENDDLEKICDSEQKAIKWIADYCKKHPAFKSEEFVIKCFEVD